MWEFECWRLYKTTSNVKLHIRGNFPYRRSLTEQQPLERIKKGSLFGYVQCDIEVPENLRVNFANFPPIFKNTSVSKNDIVDLMKTYAEEGGIMSQHRKMENVDTKLHNTKWNSDYSSALVLSATGACCYKNTPFCRVHSKEMLQQFRAVSSGRKKER